MKRFVIDASVAIKWFLDDEEDAESALLILTQFKEGRVQFILPSLWIYEVTNAFRSAVAKKRINTSEARQFTKQIKELEFNLIDLSFLIDKVIKTALKNSLSVYDASYITLAKDSDCEFITGDKKLFNIVKNKVSFVQWLGDYN